MPIDYSPGRHVLILANSEASTQMGACALLVLATGFCSETELTLGVATLRSGVF